MKRILQVFTVSTLILTSSCGQKNSHANKAGENDSIHSIEARQDTAGKKEEDTDVTDSESSTTIRFEELTLRIDSFVAYDEENKLSRVQRDTVNVLADLGETIENRGIKVKNSMLENLRLEQRYETSVTIMDEGPHCDLTEWKHYTSDWKALKLENGRFRCIAYSEEEAEKFPETTLEELKKEVRTTCGEKWAKHIDNATSLREYPVGVGISRYFLRISGQEKSSGKKIIKLVVIESSLGD